METTLKPRTFNVRARTAHVMEHHYSTENPDKPLWLLVPGAMVALVALGIILGVAYHTWYLKSMTPDRGLAWILLLAPIYAGGVFLFSYGYELYDLAAAIRLTLIVVVVTALAVVMVGALFAILSNSKSSLKSSGSSRLGVSGASGSSSSGVGLNWGRSDYWAQPTHSPPPPTSGPVAPVPLPLAMACPACGQTFFLGSKTLFCPSCGGAIPPELLGSTLGPRPPV